MWLGTKTSPIRGLETNERSNVPKYVVFFGIVFCDMCYNQLLDLLTIDLITLNVGCK